MLLRLIYRAGKEGKSIDEITKKGHSKTFESFCHSGAEHHLEMWKGRTTACWLSLNSIQKIRSCENADKRNIAAFQIEWEREKRISRRPQAP